MEADLTEPTRNQARRLAAQRGDEQTDDLTCPICRADLEPNDTCLCDLDFDRWNGSADFACPSCGVMLVITKEERWAGMYGGETYYAKMKPQVFT